MNNKTYLAIIGILLLITAVLGYKLFSSSEIVGQQEMVIEEGEFERERLELDLERMLISYDTLKTNNSQLTAEMSAQRADIEGLLKKVKDKDWSIHKLKKEASTLREIMKGYVVTIDSLNTMNQELLAENGMLSGRIQDIEAQKADLENRQATMETIIEEGQMLKANLITSQGIRLRSSGKQVDTHRASKTEMIKTCFTLYENRIAKPGDKNLYVRIVSPDAQVLHDEDSGTLDFSGEMSHYSVKRTIDYNNAEMDVCVFYNVPQELAEGDYKVFIYEGSVMIGETDLSLK